MIVTVVDDELYVADEAEFIVTTHDPVANMVTTPEEFTVHIAAFEVV